MRLWSRRCWQNFKIQRRTGGFDEVAWALGKIRDKRSIQPLYDLDKKLQAIRDPDNVTLKKLKEAVFWAIKQCDTCDRLSLPATISPIVGCHLIRLRTSACCVSS